MKFSQSNFRRAAPILAAGSLALFLTACGERDEATRLHSESEQADSAVNEQQAMAERDTNEESSGMRSQREPSELALSPSEDRVQSEDGGPQYQAGRPGYGPTSEIESGQAQGMTGASPQEVAATAEAAEEGSAASEAAAQTEMAEASEAGQTIFLEGLVMNELRNGDLGLSDEDIEQIEIRIERDKVVLSGRAPNEEASEKIEQAVSNIDQVASVENNLAAR